MSRKSATVILLERDRFTMSDSWTDRIELTRSAGCKFEVARTMLHGFDWSAFSTAGGPQRLAILAGAEDFVLGLEDGKKRFMTVVTEVSRAFALCATHETAIGLRDEIGFYQAIQSALRKLNHSERDEADLDHAIKQLVSSAVTTHGEVIDVFAAAGLEKTRHLDPVGGIPRRDPRYEA